jgi:hypothetical protein
MLVSSAASADRMLKGAQACTRHLPKAERYHNIPTHWLAAIASTESGRYHKRLGMMLPWPWTINVNGKGYYFDTKGEAINKIEEYRAKGITNIDVGCMQVNMRYHGHAFANIQQALEPRYNVAYAARFLRSNFDEFRSWKEATAAYHSRTPSRGKRYFNTVFRKWEKVTDKLGKTSDSEAILVEKPNVRKTLSRYQGYQVNEDKPQHKKVKMKTIKISAALKEGNRTVIPEKSEYQKSRENGVLVTRAPASSKQPKYVYENPAALFQEKETAAFQPKAVVF